MVRERTVLFGIKHFQQRGGRVAAEINAHFVDFIQQKQRIVIRRFLQGLYDLSGHGADVGAPVPPDFGFVAHASQRHADELAPGRACDGFAQRCFPDARRSHQAQDWSAQFFRPLLDGKIFHNPFFDFFQPVMVLVKNALGGVQVKAHAFLFVPRQGQHPVKVITHDRCLCRDGRHLPQFLEFASRFCFRFF